MRIESKTPERLVVAGRPWVSLTGATVLGAAPSLAALFDASVGPAMRVFLFCLGIVMSGVIWRYMPMTTVIFDKATHEVRLIQHRVTGNTVTRFDLGDVTGAMYQSSWSDNARLERLALKTRNGPVPLEFGYAGSPRAALAREIDAWLASA